jgi:hypothetical protein
MVIRVRTWWLQHVADILKDDTKCCIVFDGKGICVTLIQQSISGVIAA